MTVRTANTPEKARVIVKRGVRLLDKAKPGWFRKINLAKFDLGDEHRCVLGYVYRDFFAGLAKLVTDAKAAGVKDLRMPPRRYWEESRVSEYYYGFNFTANAHAEHLSQQWRRVISRRQKRDA